MEITILNKQNAQQASILLDHYEFHDYRGYRFLSENCLRAYLYADFLGALKLKDSLGVIISEHKRLVALAVVVFLPWDTQYFGQKMAKIDYFIAPGDQRRSTLLKADLLSILIKLCKKQGFVHLSCRIDTADLSGVHALEQNGFFLMDTVVTYVFNRHKHRLLKIKNMHKIRLFRKRDLPVLMKIAEQSFSKDRFHQDAHIPIKKSNGLFKEWVKSSCAESNLNKTFVVQKNKTAVGFLTFALNKELEKLSGYKIAGHGLSAVKPQAKGAYVSLVKAAVKEVILHYDCLEFDTQLNNHEVIRVWQRFGFDCIREKYTFHKWLQEK